MATLDVLERGGIVPARRRPTPYSDNALLNLANVRAQDEETKPQPTLFGPALAPTSIYTNHGDNVPPKEVKPISPHVVNNWVSKTRNVRSIYDRRMVYLNIERLSPRFHFDQSLPPAFFQGNHRTTGARQSEKFISSSLPTFHRVSR